MRRRAEAFLEQLPAYPVGRYRGRGIVIAGGGERYLPSLYVTVRAIRHVGCQLPIQVWYLGRNHEMPLARQNLLAPYGVECIDADVIRLQHPARMLNGWELKVFATLHSPFKEVLFLDADCYPCRNPTHLFREPDYQLQGAIFWPDMATFDTRLKWSAFGVPDPKRPGSVESGQYVIHKERCWRALNLAWFYNDHSDFYYRFCYGDKHTFEVAWTRCGPPFVMWNANATWEDPAYVHAGSDSRPLFIHRCADKFRFGPQAYLTWQNHDAPVFHAHLPLERQAWGWMSELANDLAISSFVSPVPRVRNPLSLPKMFCITCRQTPERGIAATQHFRDRGLEVEVFPGIHGRTFGLSAVNFVGTNYPMSPGQIGCLLSHYMLWQTLSYLPDEEILILEDDAWFEEDFREQFHQAYRDLPADWQFVFVGGVAMEGKPIEKITDRVGIMRYPCGTHAYLVKRDLLSFLLETNHEARLPVDLQLMDNSLPTLKCYTFTPSLVKQRGVCSPVDGTGENWPSTTVENQG